MTLIAPIGLQYNPRTLWFDPAGHEVKRGDAVIVRTERGVEFGHAVEDVMEVDDAAIKRLRSPLKPVVRIATEEDIAQAAEMDARGREALPVFKEMAAETNADMRPVMVEYLFDGDKAVFYFSAEERVDFRELVRRLAGHFHVRVDMRQIGVRDEARIVGGLGHCGQELCCKRMGGEFSPVSIRMAKEQDLSLNPAKISGVCGRLMCCLRYEFEAYKDFKSRAPKMGATISTPEGPAKVSELDVPREVVSLRLEDGKVVKVPLADFEPAEEGARPNAVDPEAFQRCAEPEIAAGPSIISFNTPHFTGTDKLSDGSVRVTGRRSARKGEESKGRKAKPEGSGRRPRRRKGAEAEGKGAPQRPTPTSHRSKRNRSTSISTASPAQGTAKQPKDAAQRPSQDKPRQAQQKPKSPQKGARPGQNSSALRNAPQRRKRKPQAEDRQQQTPAKEPRQRKQAPAEGGDAHRAPRRRSHRARSGGNGGNGANGANGGKPSNTSE